MLHTRSASLHNTVVETITLRTGNNPIVSVACDAVISTIDLGFAETDLIWLYIDS